MDAATRKGQAVNDHLTELFGPLGGSPFLWLPITVACYLAAMMLYQRANRNPLLLPVLTAVLMILLILWATDTPYPEYAQSTWLLEFMIGPATVALAVPLYGQTARLKKLWKPVCASLLAGSLTAIVSALLIGWALGASPEMLLSLAPKSATMPIAMEVARVAGGLPSLTTIAVAVTGISGAMMGFWILRALRITDLTVQGFALGIGAHAIGTARAVQASETAGAFAALAMSLNCIATAVLVPVVLGIAKWL